MSKHYRGIPGLVLSVVQGDKRVAKRSPELTLHLNRQTHPDGLE